VGKLCVLDLAGQEDWVPAVLTLNAYITARLRVTWKLACTACCTAQLYNLSVDEFRSQDFGLKLNWEAPGIELGVFYSVSRMER
jgi:hypothetical protein